MKPTKLVCILIFISPLQLKAEVFSCEDSGSTELDMFGSNTSHNAPSKKNINSWIIDTNKGWRRADIETFSGSCTVENGYTVCKTDTPYGEAIFSIHPDDSNFILVYLDYGIDVLAFVGSCKKTWITLLAHYAAYEKLLHNLLILSDISAFYILLYCSHQEWFEDAPCFRGVKYSNQR